MVILKEFHARSSSDTIQMFPIMFFFFFFNYVLKTHPPFLCNLHSLLKAELELCGIAIPLQMIISVFKRGRGNPWTQIRVQDFMCPNVWKRLNILPGWQLASPELPRRVLLSG